MRSVLWLPWPWPATVAHRINATAPTLLIYFPDKTADRNRTVVKFSGSRDEAGACGSNGKGAAVIAHKLEDRSPTQRAALLHKFGRLCDIPHIRPAVAG
jgi:hypothetical protein